MILSGQNTLDYERGMADAERGNNPPNHGVDTAWAVGYLAGLKNMQDRDRGYVPPPTDAATIRRIIAAPRRDEEFSP